MIGIVPADGIVMGFEVGLDDFCIHQGLVGKTLLRIFGETPLANPVKIAPI